MIAFRVDDMTCGHCAGTITRAVREVDDGAQVQVDLALHRVSVVSARAEAQAFQDAIAEAGYTPVPLATTAAPDEPVRSGGCCCGSGASRCGG